MRTILISAAIASTGTALAGTELVSNGGFEASDNGPCQVGYCTTVTDWSVPDPNQSLSYTFLFAASGTGSGDNGVNNQYGGTLSLYGPANGVNNGLGPSPQGGNYIAQDSAYDQGAISQTISGLTAGDSYVVSFYWAAAQQNGFNGPTYDQWQVSLGGQTLDTPTVNIDSHGFSGWMSQSLTFTATGPTEVLSFFANGGPSGVPPFALLDGVSMMAVPEPSTWAMMLIGFGGLGVAAFRSRRKAAAAA
jgi:PEP-CTERM motif